MSQQSNLGNQNRPQGQPQQDDRNLQQQGADRSGSMEQQQQVSSQRPLHSEEKRGTTKEEGRSDNTSRESDQQNRSSDKGNQDLGGSSSGQGRS